MSTKWGRMNSKRKNKIVEDYETVCDIMRANVVYKLEENNNDVVMSQFRQRVLYWDH